MGLLYHIYRQNLHVCAFCDGPGAHTASYKMGTGSFPGVKWPGRDVDHPPPSRAEVKERVEL